MDGGEVAAETEYCDVGIARTREEMKGDRVGTAARGEANKENERCRGIREVREQTQIRIHAYQRGRRIREN